MLLHCLSVYDYYSSSVLHSFLHMFCTVITYKEKGCQLTESARESFSARQLVLHHMKTVYVCAFVPFQEFNSYLHMLFATWLHLTATFELEYPPIYAMLDCMYSTPQARTATPAHCLSQFLL